MGIMATATVALVNLAMSSSLGNKFLDVKKFSELFGGGQMEEKRRTIVLLILAKMIIIPGIEFAIFTALIPYLPVMRNKLVLIVIFIEMITPTANMTVVMATIVNQLQAAETVAVAILGMYIVSIPTIMGLLSMSIYIADP